MEKTKNTKSLNVLGKAVETNGGKFASVTYTTKKGEQRKTGRIRAFDYDKIAIRPPRSKTTVSIPLNKVTRISCNGVVYTAPKAVV